MTHWPKNLILSAMDKVDMLECLERLDQHLATPTTLYVYGSAVVILLDAPERASMDIDADMTLWRSGT